MTPMTISSLMPSVSILMLPLAPGEGGGVWSYVALPLLLGRSANETVLVDVIDDRGRDDDTGDCEVDECDLLTFFVGGGWASEGMEGLEREGR